MTEPTGCSQSLQSRPRVALHFFGITRSLKFTKSSIEANVLRPLSKFGDLRVYGHFFHPKEIANPRSGEFGDLDPAEHTLLDFDDLVLDDPSIDVVTDLFEAVKPYGSNWKDEFQSLRNLCQQLVSLDKVTALSQAWSPDLYVYCRPDLMYHDAIGDILTRATTGPENTVYLPNWQDWPDAGRNDRFAVIKGQQAALAYGCRRHQALAYCQTHNQPLPAESLVSYALRDMRVETFPHRATRVRFDGTYRQETFDYPEYAARIRAIRAQVWQPGLRDALIAALRLLQSARYGARYRGLGYETLNGVAKKRKSQDAPKRLVAL